MSFANQLNALSFQRKLISWLHRLSKLGSLLLLKLSELLFDNWFAVLLMSANFFGRHVIDDFYPRSISSIYDLIAHLAQGIFVHVVVLSFHLRYMINMLKRDETGYFASGIHD